MLSTKSIHFLFKISFLFKRAKPGPPVYGLSTGNRLIKFKIKIKIATWYSLVLFDLKVKQLQAALIPGLVTARFFRSFKETGSQDPEIKND